MTYLSPAPPFAPALPAQGVILGPPPLQHSTRVYHPLDCFGFSTFPFALDIVFVPSYSHAKDIPCCKDAMMNELLALESNRTWDLVPQPLGLQLLAVNGYIL